MDISDSDHERGTVPYSRVLSVVGAHLDDNRAHLMRLLETARGLEVQWRERTGGVRLTTERFDTLLAEWDQRGGRFDTHLWRGNRHAFYRRLLRAIGEVLERRGAGEVLFEMLQQDLIVSYRDATSEPGIVGRDRLLRLGPREQRDLIRGPRLSWRERLVSLLRAVPAR